MKKHELYVGGQKILDVLDHQLETTTKQSDGWSEPKNLTHKDLKMLFG